MYILSLDSLYDRCIYIMWTGSTLTVEVRLILKVQTQANRIGMKEIKENAFKGRCEVDCGYRRSEVVVQVSNYNSVDMYCD